MKTYTCDVAVVAGGCAGLTAAVAAAECGASVLVLEKSGELGGAANMGTGLFAVETPIQKKYMVGITVEEAFDKFMDTVHYRVDPRLVREYIGKSPDTIRWLEEKGVEFVLPTKFFKDAESTWLIPDPGNAKDGTAGASKSIVNALKASAEKLGVEVLYHTAGTELLTDAGKVVGVKAVSEADGEITVNAKSVILATGGFGGNPEMIRERTGFEWGKNCFTFARPTNTGDGIRMSDAIGGGSSRTIMEITVTTPMEGNYPAASLMFRQPALMVNLQGERVMDEEVAENGNYAANQVAMQTEGCAFLILDEAVAKDYMENGPECYNMVSGYKNCKLDTFFEEMKAAEAAGEKFLYSADSVEELAEKTGIDAARLQETLDEYNGYCETGVDEYFDKSSRSLKAIRGPKYFAARLYPGGYGSLGGIRIDYKAQVLDKEFDVIPGLYAAGLDACSIFDDSYIFTLPGNTMGFAVNSGRMAGENAAAYSKNL